MSTEGPFDYCDLAEIKEALRLLQQLNTENLAVKECIEMLQRAILIRSV